MSTQQFRRIAVLGAGTMGHGISQIAAQAGYNVSMRDISEEILQKAMGNIASNLDRSVQRGRLSQEEMKNCLSRIKATVDLEEAVSGADIVIEAVPERLDLKIRILRDVEKLTPSSTTLATNTSSLSVDELSHSLSRPNQFIGMHFFNPTAVMRLVEVVPAPHTLTSVTTGAVEFCKKIGKTPVLVKKDSPGFIVNRVLVPYLNEAARTLDRGEAKMNEIDSAIQFKAKFPMGPFLLMDYIGIDIIADVLGVFEQKLGPHYKASTSIWNLRSQGKLGRKTNQGFYNYAEGPPKLAEADGTGFDPKNLLAHMVNEASKLVDDDIADEPGIDTAMKLGANLPEGPFEIAKRVGTHNIISSLKELSAKHGEGYALSKHLSKA